MPRSFSPSGSSQPPFDPATQAERVRALNDQCRHAGPFGSSTNRWVLTQGVDMMGPLFVTDLVRAIRRYDAFDADDDPWGEHDFGSIKLFGEQCFWKIDYYDLTRTAGSPNAADPAVTYRVLTIMLASEY